MRTRSPLAALTSLAVAIPLSIATVPAVATAAAPRAKVAKAQHEHHGLNDVDRRFGNKRYAPRADQQRAVERLSKDVQVTWSRTGTARSLQADKGALTARSTARPDAIARSFLGRNPELFGLKAAEVADLRLTAHDRQAGASFLRYQQVSEGLDVHGATVLVTVDRQGRVLIAGGSLVPNAAASPAATLSAADAVEVAVDDVNGKAGPKAAKPIDVRRGKHRFTNNAAVKDYKAARPIWAELVKVATADGVRSAWRVSAERASNADYVELVDAGTGEVLLRENQVSQDARGTVFQGDDPEAGGRSEIVFPSGWVNAGGKTTSGNNTNTYQDAEGDNSAQDDDQPQKDDQHFNYTWNDTWGNSDGEEGDLPLSGADRDAAVTQLFYYTNWYHDYVYGLGFTETANNFQNDNGGNGGTGGDAVEAESDANYTGKQCDDEGTAVKCLNNANFNANGPDGTKPRMQMYVGDTDPGSASSRRTQRANNRDTVIHEYTHGVSGRIISNGNLSGGIQSKSLGEGWSDALATSINNDPVYGEYNNGDYDDGIRGVAYNEDSLEYGDFAGDSEHDNGRIWAMNMWETRAALIAKYDFGPGKAMHEQLMILGMKNTLNTPSFHDARTGYLVADSILNATGTPGQGANWCRIWFVFADNELGQTNSADPDTANSGSITTSTTTPAACSPTAAIAAVPATPEGTAITFNGSGSTTGGDAGDTRTYAWDLDNDGQYDDSTLADPSRAYGQDGPRTVGLQVTNSSGYVDTASVSFNVTNVAPTVAGTLSGSTSEGALVTLDATITDPGWLEPLEGTVNWGDGTGTQDLTGVLENGQPTATLTATATHRYGDNGTYTIEICGSDDDTETCVNRSWSVVNVIPSVSLQAITPIDEGGSVEVNGSFTDPGWLDTHTATIDLGDGNGQQPVTVTKTEGGPGTPDSGTFSLTAPYGDDGVFAVTARVTDDDSGTGQASRNVTVSNVNPTLTFDESDTIPVQGVPTVVTDVDATVPFSSTVTDPGSDDLTVTWDWGDGAPSPDETVVSLVNPPNPDPDPSPTVQPRSITPETAHQFLKACLYTVTETARDDDNGFASDSVQVAVFDDREIARNSLLWLGEYGYPGKRPLIGIFDQSDETLSCYLKLVRHFSQRYSAVRPVNTLKQAATVLGPPLLTPALNARNQLDASLLAGWLDIMDGSIHPGAGVDTNLNLVPDTPWIQVLRNAEAALANPSTPLLVLLEHKLIIEKVITLHAVAGTVDVILPW